MHEGDHGILDHDHEHDHKPAQAAQRQGRLTRLVAAIVIGAAVLLFVASRLL